MMGMPMFFGGAQVGPPQPVKFTFSDRDIQKFKRKLKKGGGRAATFRSWFHLSTPKPFTDKLIEEHNNTAYENYNRNNNNNNNDNFYIQSGDENMTIDDLERQPIKLTQTPVFVRPKIDLDLIAQNSPNTPLKCEPQSIPSDFLDSSDFETDSVHRLSSIFLLLTALCTVIIISTVMFLQQPILLASSITSLLILMLCIFLYLVSRNNTL